MRSPLRKNKKLFSFLVPVSIFFLASCAVYQTPNYQIRSEIPVKVDIPPCLKSRISIKGISVLKEAQGYEVWVKVENPTPYRVDFLYRAVFYTAKGVPSDYLTERWKIGTLDPQSGATLKVFVPKEVVKNPSKVEIYFRNL